MKKAVSLKVDTEIMIDKTQLHENTKLCPILEAGRLAGGNNCGEQNAFCKQSKCEWYQNGCPAHKDRGR